MIDANSVHDRIRKVAMEESGLSKEAAHDVAFHMTDWVENLEAFHAFCLRPESLSDEQVSALLMGFLVHVPNHVAAAGKLFAGIPVADVFGVGAISEDEA